jgi:hypothetical protein
MNNGFIRVHQDHFHQILNGICEMEEFETHKTFHLINNCLLHIFDDIISVIIRERVGIINFANHTILINRFEEVLHSFQHVRHCRINPAFLIMIYHNLKHMMTDVNIWCVHSFMKLSKLSLECSSTKKI